MKTETTSASDYKPFFIPQLQEWEAALRSMKSNAATGPKQNVVLCIKGSSTASATVALLPGQTISFEFPILDFGNEPYKLKKVLLIKIICHENDFTASHEVLNLHATNTHPIEAVEDLKSLILDTFDRLSAENESNLGPHPKMQRELLLQYIERK